MKTIEGSVKDCIEQQLQNGIIEKVLTSQLEKCIEQSVKGLFEYNGAIKKTIDEKIKSVMTPYLENYNYGEYIVKLDDVMKDILNELTFDNRKLLENFSNLASPEEIKEIKISDIFEKWTKKCENKIDTDKIAGYDYEGGYISCQMVTDCEKCNYTSREDVKINFICEEDEDLNFSFIIYKYAHSNNRYSAYHDKKDISSIRLLDDLEILLMRIGQGIDNVILDEECIDEDIFIKYREE